MDENISKRMNEISDLDIPLNKKDIVSSEKDSPSHVSPD